MYQVECSGFEGKQGPSHTTLKTAGASHVVLTNIQVSLLPLPHILSFARGKKRSPHG